MREENLLDLARIDVRTTRNDEVLGPVLQRQVALFVEYADVAGVQPAAPERRRGGLCRR